MNQTFFEKLKRTCPVPVIIESLSEARWNRERPDVTGLSSGRPFWLGINQKYEVRRAVFRHIYGGNSMIHRIPGCVIVNISIRSIPTTHAHAYQSDAGALWEFRAYLTARRTSCCYLFTHYITLLPSRVSPANLHYKCRRRCYHRSLMRALWRRWRMLHYYGDESLRQ